MWQPKADCASWANIQGYERLHSRAGGGRNTFAKFFWQQSQVVGIWNESSMKSCLRFRDLSVLPLAAEAFKSVMESRFVV